MAEIRIKREHELGLEEARQLARRWAEVAEERLHMHCSYEHGKGGDRVAFRRAGVHGELKVTAHSFVLHAKLGLLLGIFKERIETEIVHNLDLLLDHDDPLGAFNHHVAKHAAKRSGAKSGAAKKHPPKQSKE